MITTPEVQKIYADIQKQLFYLIPEKWDKIFLYASVIEQMEDLETGELFFYYYPKGILKKNPINVYEIPSKFSLNEDEYIHLVQNLYDTIKELRQIYKENSKRIWSNITIKLIGVKFEIEFDYENLTHSKYSNTERHIIWKYKYLNIPLETFSKKERKLIQKYLDEYVVDISKKETYTESIYKRPIKNVLEYNREKKEEDDEDKEQFEEKMAEEENKEKLEEQQRYTYTKKERKELKKQYSKKIEEQKKEQEDIEPIEPLADTVKSQILNHL